MKKWKMPGWLKPYVKYICNTGGNDITELMNDHDCTVVNNAPRAMICVAVKSQVRMLELMRQEGVIP